MIQNLCIYSRVVEEFGPKSTIPSVFPSLHREAYTKVCAEFPVPYLSNFGRELLSIFLTNQINPNGTKCALKSNDQIF
jgi:hypothetical protein